MNICARCPRHAYGCLVLCSDCIELVMAPAQRRTADGNNAAIPVTDAVRRPPFAAPVPGTARLALPRG